MLIFLLVFDLISKSLKSDGSITGAFINIAKYYVSKYLYLTSSVKHNTFSAALPPITVIQNSTFQDLHFSMHVPHLMFVGMGHCSFKVSNI